MPDGAGAEPPIPQVASSAVFPGDTSARIEIVLLDGVTVRVDEAALRRVLAALGRR